MKIELSLRGASRRGNPRKCSVRKWLGVDCRVGTAARGHLAMTSRRGRSVALHVAAPLAPIQSARPAVTPYLLFDFGVVNRLSPALAMRCATKNKKAGL